MQRLITECKNNTANRYEKNKEFHRYTQAIKLLVLLSKRKIYITLHQKRGSKLVTLNSVSGFGS